MKKKREKIKYSDLNLSFKRPESNNYKFYIQKGKYNRFFMLVNHYKADFCVRTYKELL